MKTWKQLCHEQAEEIEFLRTQIFDLREKLNASEILLKDELLRSAQYKDGRTTAFDEALKQARKQLH